MEQASMLREILESQGIDPAKADIKQIKKHIIASLAKKEILSQVRSQQRGVPYEYQFGAICWWLGKCKHLQFMDTQPEFPYLSKIENIGYPDIYAIFDYDSTDFPCFIEVKVDNKKRLKLTKSYINGLKRYPLLKDCPLLIAWKHRDFWVLFDVNTFITSKGNVNVEFGEAGKANLMSVLVGDFCFKGFKVGVEWGYTLEPINYTIDDIRSGKTHSFIGKIRDISVYNPSMNKTETASINPFKSPLRYLLPFLGEWVPFNRYTETSVIDGERNGQQISLFAYQTLIFGIQSHASFYKQNTSWKNLLIERKFIFNIDEIYNLIYEMVDKDMGFEYSPLIYKPSINNPCMQGYND